MSRPSISEPQAAEQDAGGLVRLGGWLFRKRTALPVPIALALLVVPPSQSDAAKAWLLAAGLPLVVLGELIRLWGVHHIGAVSRTRSERLGPLIDGGPFAHVRNPLYIGNVLVWLGFAVSAHLPWLVPIVFVLLAIEYHAIVRWEERLLVTRIGAPYQDYMRRVPRWVPKASGGSMSGAHAAFSWAQTLFSERGTLIAIGVGYLLLALKAQFS